MPEKDKYEVNKALMLAERVCEEGYIRREAFLDVADIIKKTDLSDKAKLVTCEVILFDLGIAIATRKYGEVMFVDDIQVYNRIRRGETTIPRDGVIYQAPEFSLDVEDLSVMLGHVPMENPLRKYYEEIRKSSPA